MERYQGKAGWAETLEWPDVPEAAESVPEASWLLTAPHAHPVWSQYVLVVVRLRDNVPGFSPPVREFPSATHELDLFALRPDIAPGHHEGSLLPSALENVLGLPPDRRGQYRPGTWTSGTEFTAFVLASGMPMLTPVNVSEQFEATDAEMVNLARYAAFAVADGKITPETADAPERIRAGWHEALDETMAHVRGRHDG
jgi:hypothetical protein